MTRAYVGPIHPGTSDLTVSKRFKRSGSKETSMGIHPESRIRMADGSAKPIREVRQGDQVACGDGRVASVRRVVWDYGPSQTVAYNTLTLTPQHPVRFPLSKQGVWV